MGVYNPWAEMPKSCVACYFRYCCPLSSPTAHGIFGFKHPDCPLVEVKAPHGDLVDRDKVICEMCLKYTKAERQKKLMYASVEVKQGFCDLLTDAPTVLEAEGKYDG